MAEEQFPPGTNDIPEALAEANAGTRRWRWVLLIWVVPAAAVLVGAWLALRGILNEGPKVVISFKAASGLEAGKTRVKYKDVDVGMVSSIGLSEDRATVLVEADLAPHARGLIGDDTRFWVVRPRITGGQAFGLATILSGVYIALDPGQSSASSRRRFEGLETPPVVTADVPGRQFILHAQNLGSIDVGSPVYFRRVRVGQAVSAELDPDGKGVTFRIFVNEPYDRYVTRATRFWNASGIDFSADSGGFHLQTESLASVAIGGVAFQTPEEAAAAPPAEPNAEFELFDDRESAFKQPATVRDAYILYFNQSVRGLNVGSPVDFRGVVIGEVVRISLDYEPARPELRPAVEISLYPERIAARFRRPEALPSGVRAQTLRRLVQRGLRAQLKTGNLVTGQLYIALDFFPNAQPARLAATDPPEIPTVPGGFDEIQSSVAALLQKLEQVPFDKFAAELGSSAATLRSALTDLSALVTRLDKDVVPELTSTLREARGALDKAQGALGEDAPLQGDLQGTLREVTRAAEAVRSLADSLERHPESLLRGRREESAP
jgi:paraquat-inducible protein B